MSDTRQRVSLATYRAARYTLVHRARNFRQWIKSDPPNAEKWAWYLKEMQRHLAALRAAERRPMMAEGGGGCL